MDHEKSDFGLVYPITLPENARIPDPNTGRSTSEEYDQYFRILRDQQGLKDWSKLCTSLLHRLLDDLDTSTLEPADERDILRGFLIVLQTTLMRWVNILEIDDSDQGKT